MIVKARYDPTKVTDLWWVIDYTPYCCILFAMVTSLMISLPSINRYSVNWMLEVRGHDDPTDSQ